MHTQASSEWTNLTTSETQRQPLAINGLLVKGPAPKTRVGDLELPRSLFVTQGRNIVGELERMPSRSACSAPPKTC
jgi:hypothetical protein